MPYTCPQCNHHPIQDECPKCGWKEQLITPKDIRPTAPPPSYPMATLEATDFEMGSAISEAGRDPDEDLHRVTLTYSYRIGRTEVSQLLYYAVTGDNPSHFVGERLPVENLTWFEACSFCNEYSLLHGYQPAYRFDFGRVLWNPNRNGFRLPTEAEWENAAKRAMKDASRSKQAWFEDTAFQQTRPVGQSSGISDMAGNVWEWCWDFYAPYATAPQRDPIGPASGNYRVARGGSWADKKRVIRPANRASAPPKHRSNSIGFRLAQTLFTRES